jgi:hypothetical protein
MLIFVKLTCRKDTIIPLEAIKKDYPFLRVEAYQLHIGTAGQ